jgi:hypothetical protein
MMACGEIAISHDTFRALPSDRSHNYLRELLASLGVLPPFVATIERMLPWLATKLTELTDEEANLISRFAHWQVLRRLRTAAANGTLTTGSANVARTQINAAIRLCRWATAHTGTITKMTPADLENYFIERQYLPNAQLWMRLDDGHVSVISTVPDAMDWLLANAGRAGA